MAQYFRVHPSNPEPRLVAQAARILRGGGLVAYPTDSCYAFGCRIGDTGAMQRLRQVRRIDERHHLTLMCRDLSDIAVYAKVDNAQYRLLKRLAPGSFTVILQATRELPRRLLHARRKTIGVRVPQHPLVRALLAQLDEPLLSATAFLPEESEPATDAGFIRERLEHELDLVIDGGSCGTLPTTVVDLTGKDAVLLRRGKGEPSLAGLDA
ncbi:MAG: threonylcarbamoyl-AMP synthase [Burkholderiales bacterium]|nr:threonylcarbamoyl-AMP synthase [Burkholderiales bacterium]